MGAPRQAGPVQYFSGLLSAEIDLLDSVEDDLRSIFGPIASRSETLAWTESTFYQAEMGTGLLRRFVSFAALHSPGELAGFKLQTQLIESRYCRANPARGRRINVDPGYLDSFKVVLASTKNAGQRIYLGSGIYAEATLMYHTGNWHGLPYTYRDYLWPETRQFLSALRAAYLEQLRHSSL